MGKEEKGEKLFALLAERRKLIRKEAAWEKEKGGTVVPQKKKKKKKETWPRPSVTWRVHVPVEPRKKN